MFAVAKTKQTLTVMKRAIPTAFSAVLAAALTLSCSGDATTAGRAGAGLPTYLDTGADIEARVEDALARMTTREKVRIIHAQSKFSSAGVARLGIPDFWTADGPHGIRPDVLWDEWEQAGQTNDSCVAFPALTCLAATWDTTLAGLYGVSLGEEARYRGKDMVLGPGVNIYRTPLCGRNFEYMGEDPHLAGRMAANYVRGLQSTGVAACVKHFCLNNDEENRFDVNVVVDDRAMREIYLPAFRAAVMEGGAWGVMGAYNLYRDQHLCHNDFTLNKILKGEWGFDGVAVSDWGGTHDTDQAIENGLDMEFGTWTDGLHTGASNAYDNYHLALPYLRQIESGARGTRELDDKARRVLRLFFRTTMSGRTSQGSMCSEAHYAAARKVAESGIVLLRNEGGVLPLRRDARRIVVVGENAIKSMTVGGGSSSLKAQREVSPLEGLRAAMPGSKVEFARGYVGDTSGEYNGVTSGQDLSDSRAADELVAEAVAMARGADYVVVFGGLNKSDHQDCEGHDRLSYSLPYGQDALVEALADVTERLVFVNISGNAVAMPWAERVEGIVQGWYLGSEAGTALAAVLTGEATPGGKLPFTWCKRLEDYAAHALGAYPGVRREGGKTVDEEYREGVFVGYRWAERQGVEPLFAFGHGLSYTTFEMTDLRLSGTRMPQGGELTATVRLKNTGDRAGSETVMLFVGDRVSSVERPLRELKGFAKVELRPGESRDVSIRVADEALKFFDSAAGKWIAEPGDFTIECQTTSDKLNATITYY